MIRTLLPLAALLLAGCMPGSHLVERDGARQLAPCDGPPRCVASHDDAGDRQVQPLRVEASPHMARLALMQYLKGREDVEILRAEDDYIHSVFITPRLRFRDDVEFLIAADGDATRIDVRSESRIGYHDLGTNRQRIESLRSHLGPAGVR